MMLKSQFTFNLPLIRFDNECAISGANSVSGELDLSIVQRICLLLNKLHINTDINPFIMEAVII